MSPNSITSSDTPLTSFGAKRPALEYAVLHASIPPGAAEALKGVGRDRRFTRVMSAGITEYLRNGGKRAVRPVEQGRRHAVMLHQEISFPMIGRLAFAGELRAPALEFKLEVLLLAQHRLKFVLVVFRPVKLRLQRRGPTGIFLAPESREPGRLRARVPRPLLPLSCARGDHFHELVQRLDAFDVFHYSRTQATSSQMRSPDRSQVSGLTFEPGGYPSQRPSMRSSVTEVNSTAKLHWQAL